MVSDQTQEFFAMVNPFLPKMRVMEIFCENQSGIVCAYKNSEEKALLISFPIVLLLYFNILVKETQEYYSSL